MTKGLQVSKKIISKEVLEGARARERKGFYFQAQVTLNCNLACKYCFEDHQSKGVMSLDTLQNVIVKCVEHFRKINPDKNEITFYWHGGEPLLAGIDFYKKVIELESRYPEIRFSNKIQTNGAAMTKKMAAFMVENNFEVGFSFDGPEDIQNKHRVLKNGRSGSFEAVMKGVENYREASKAPYIPIIAVVSKYTVERGPKVFYEFFKGLRSCLQFQPYDITWHDLLKENIDPDASEFMPGTEEYAQFVIDLFDLWFRDDPGKIVIHDLKGEVKDFLTPRFPRSIIDKKRCSEERTIIDPVGNVYSCDMYLNNEKTSLGNINTDPLDTILERKYALWEKIKKVFRKGGNGYQCVECPYGDMCPGGCMTCMKYNYLVLKGYSLDDPSHIKEINLFFNKNFSDCGDAYYCGSFKKYRDHIGAEVKKEVASSKLDFVSPYKMCSSVPEETIPRALDPHA